VNGPSRVVTVSATYGAGGSLVAPLLAERLGLPFADRLIPADDTAPPGPGGEWLTDEERAQTSKGRFFARLAAVTGGFGMPVPTAEHVGGGVREHVESSITGLVATGGAVILGRAAAVVLAGHPRSFHVRLDGPPGRRAARAMQFEGIDEETAKARLEETDRARARYVDRLYGRDATDPHLYHLILDGTVMTSADVVDVIAAAAKAFWKSIPSVSRPAGPA
jgi:cytidylate kinase